MINSNLTKVSVTGTCNEFQLANDNNNVHLYIALYPGQPGSQRCTISYKYSHTNLHKQSH